MVRRIVAATVLASLPLAMTSTAGMAQSVGDFYQGRTLALNVGSAPGGGYDSYARTISRFYSRHLPGSPTIVVRNMPGASGLRLAGYMYNAAPKDGSEIAGIHNTAVVEQLMGSQVQFNARAYNWLGSANQLTSTCISHANSGVTTFQQATEKELLIGATGSASSSTQLVPSFLNSLTGTQFRIIRGYPSTSSVILAMERGEVGGLCGIGWDSARTQIWDDIQAGRIHVIVQTGMTRNADLPDVPVSVELTRNAADRQVMEFLVARQYMGRPYIAPPGVPEDRVAALRAAFTATMNDPEFQAAAEQARLPLDPLTGQQVQDHVNALFELPPTVLARANAATQVNPDAVGDASLNWIDLKGVNVERMDRRTLHFSHQGASQTAVLGGAKITVNGSEAKIDQITSGMTCDVSFLGNGDVARSLDCRS